MISLARIPEFFVSHKASPGLIIGMVFVLSIGVALGLVLLELAAWLVGERVRRSMHWVFVFGLALLTVLPPVQRLVDGSDLLDCRVCIADSAFSFRSFMFAGRRSGCSSRCFHPSWWHFRCGFCCLPPWVVLSCRMPLKHRPILQINNPVPVVLVVLDEFNITALLDAEGRIDPVRFPNFAALASQSQWFTNAVATYVETAVAVSAILTGRQPRAGCSAQSDGNRSSSKSVHNVGRPLSS